DWAAVIPFAYWDRAEHTLLSPLWAHWKAEEHETYFAPWLLSWETRRSQRNELWLAAGLGHASWGEKAGAHYALPFYYRDAAEHTLLTPIVGWNQSPGYFYPFTPLAGVWKNECEGSWVFPLYSHAREKNREQVRDHFLLLGGYSKTKSTRHAWFYPVFSFQDDSPLDSVPAGNARYGDYGTKLWCLPGCWYA